MIFVKWKGFLQNDHCLANLNHPRARSDGRELLAMWLASLASLLAKNTNKSFSLSFLFFCSLGVLVSSRHVKCALHVLKKRARELSTNYI
jgi:hypothetical protein